MRWTFMVEAFTSITMLMSKIVRLVLITGFVTDAKAITLTGISDSSSAVANRQLEILAQTVVEKYFSTNDCLLVLSEKGLMTNLRSNNTVIFLETDSEDESCTEKLHRFLNKTFAYKCDGYVVQFRNPKCAFNGWFETNKNKFVPRHNPKYLFLPVYPDVLEYADDLLSMSISDISANILVAEVLPNGTDGWITLSTNNFYLHPATPGRVPKIFMDEWSSNHGLRYNVDLYPDKVRNLMGKPFRMAMGDYPPYVTPNGDGLENQISLQFCLIRNCSPVAVTDDTGWGGVNDVNLTGTGVLGNVYSDKADVGAMGVYLWHHTFMYHDYSAAYHQGEVTLILPKPKRIGGWIIPFLPFKFEMWIAFFLSIFFSTISLYFVTKAAIKFTRFAEKLKKKHQFTSLGDSFLRSIGLAVLQMPSSRLIGDSPNRYLFTSFEFVYLVLSAIYSAELASFLTVAKYNPPIDTFHDFAQSGIDWFGEHLVWIYTLMESTEPDAMEIVRRFHIVTIPELKEIAKEGKYGLTAERIMAGALAEQEHVTEEVIPLYHIMKEALFGSSIVTLLKKGGPYNEHYNRIVNKVVDHGLTIYWESYTVREYMNYRIQQAFQEAKTIHVDSEPTVIQLSHIEGIIYLYFIGIFLSFIIFFYEIIHKRKSKKKKFKSSSEKSAKFLEKPTKREISMIK